MIRRPPRSTHCISSAASDVYKRQDLADLDRDLEPFDLIAKIKTYVLGKGSDHWELDDEFDDSTDDKYRDSEVRLAKKATALGESFATSEHELDELGFELFSNEWMPYRKDVDLRWLDIIQALRSSMR